MDDGPTGTERLAAFALGLHAEDVPAEVGAAARLHALDTVGCALAGWALGVGDEGVAAAREECPRGPASTVGHQNGLPPAAAALANGMLAHGLDFDDTHAGAIVHVGAVIVPAALAAAEAHGASGAELQTAIVAGGEVFVRLAAAAPSAFHARGFHPTSVCGVFGATVAVARLRGLDPERTVHALGIAGSMASGLFAHLSDGSATKRVHPGWAAHGAHHAVALAAHGASGPAAVLEDRFGLYATHVPRVEPALRAELADLGSRWETLRVAFKPYPACHFLHACVDAAAAAAGGNGVRVEAGAIAEIVAQVPEAAVPIVLEPAAAKVAPRSPYDAKFSLQYSVAAMLVHGEVDVRSYTPAAIADADVLELARRVRYEAHDFATYPGAFPGAVRIRTHDGRELTAELPHQRGAPEHPLTGDEVRAKFGTNAGLALPDDAVALLEQALLGVDAVSDVRGAFTALGSAGRAAG